MQSLRQTVPLGYPPANPLPIVDDFGQPRRASEIVERLLAIIGLATSASSSDRQRIHIWLENEGAWKALTSEERAFIAEGEGDVDYLLGRVEAAWALACTLGLIDQLDFGSGCSNQFAAVMPGAEKSESSERLRGRLRPRSFDEIAAACDLAYCLHWAIREALRNGTSIPGKVHGYVVLERRRALEWVLSDYAWDDVPMDT